MNATLSKISVSSLKIDGHSVPVPEGLSELLESTWVSSREEKDLLKKYDRKVIQRNGNFVTLLTKR